MIDFHKQLVEALQTILPTHYEMTVSSKTATPCITYIERDNSAQQVGDTIGYSRLSYTVKVWGNDIGQLQTYAIQIDNVLRPLGFKRISSNEMYDPNSTMIQKIMAYEAYAQEVF